MAAADVTRAATTVPSIRTARFELVSMSLAFMHHLVARDLAAAEAEIDAVIPVDFPDRLDGFLQFRIADLSTDPAAQPWLGRSIVLTEPDGLRVVIGSAGFHAPPGPDGRVEIGYRVEPGYRRQGVATEVARALFDWAHEHGVDRFRASVVSRQRGLAGDHPRLRLRAGRRPDRRHRRRGARLPPRRLAA